MTPKQRYWRLSPNVMNDHREQEVDAWKEAICEGYAVMGDREGAKPEHPTES